MFNVICDAKLGVGVFLKSIELFGFKSFADKSRIDFTEGISALLGPNGCGKSNVVDAIKWVLGEQSTRSLRAERMEDVIFAGTEGRKALSVAEVTLTLAAAAVHVHPFAVIKPSPLFILMIRKSSTR